MMNLPSLWLLPPILLCYLLLPISYGFPTADADQLTPNGLDIADVLLNQPLGVWVGLSISNLTIGDCYVDRLHSHLDIFDSSLRFGDLVDDYYKTFPENRKSAATIGNLLHSTREMIVACQTSPDRGESGRRYGFTPFSDKSPEEMAALSSSTTLRALSEQSSTSSRRRNLNQFFASSGHDQCSYSEVIPPESFDWRTRGAVTSVKHQSACGSCWVFAAVGAIESHMLIHNRTHLTARQLDLAEQQFVQCVDGCGGGNAAAAFKYVQDHGIAYEDSMPYSPYRRHDDSDQCYAGPHRVYPVKGYCVKNYESGLVPDEDMQQALVKFGPLYLTIATGGQENHASGIIDDEYCPKSEYAMNHAVLLVGYTRDAWILKNCWGDYWGEAGFFKVARGNRNICGINTEMAWPLV